MAVAVEAAEVEAAEAAEEELPPPAAAVSRRKCTSESPRRTRFASAWRERRGRSARAAGHDEDAHAQFQSLPTTKRHTSMRDVTSRMCEALSLSRGADALLTNQRHGGGISLSSAEICPGKLKVWGRMGTAWAHRGVAGAGTIESSAADHGGWARGDVDARVVRVYPPFYGSPRRHVKSLTRC